MRNFCVMEPANLWRTIADLENALVPHVLVTLIGVRGSAPAAPGAKMVLCREGLPHGTIGGGKLEAAALQRARELLDAAGGIERVVWNLQSDIGMTCGGEVEVLFEPRCFSAWTIAVFGAGHVSQALMAVLLPLEARLLCFDPRVEWIGRLPKSARLRAEVCGNAAEAVDRVPEGAFVCSITQGHASDLPVLERAFRRGCFPFIGCIGSASKAARLRGDLMCLGIGEADLERLRCPLGLDLGGNAPHEIAVSIAAQLLQERDRFGGRPEKMK
jgi:xanthine dehydrogenase accessory factor